MSYYEYYDLYEKTQAKANSKYYMIFGEVLKTREYTEEKFERWIDLLVNSSRLLNKLEENGIELFRPDNHRMLWGQASIFVFGDTVHIIVDAAKKDEAKRILQLYFNEFPIRWAEAYLDSIDYKVSGDHLLAHNLFFILDEVAKGKYPIYKKMKE